MDEAENVTVRTEDGRLLEASVSGPPGGTVLVFHTGTPCGLVPLPAGLDLAPMGIRTVMYARPGYGRSTPEPGRTVADAAGDTAAILAAVGAGTFLNLGWSGGGPYALACAALLADQCLATAVIAGPAPYTMAEDSSPVRAWYEADEDNQLVLAGDIEGFRRAVDAFVSKLANVRGHIRIQFLTEVIVLSLLGGAAGVVAATAVYAHGKGDRHPRRRLGRRYGRGAGHRRPRRAAARYPRRPAVTHPGPLEHLAF